MIRGEGNAGDSGVAPTRQLPSSGFRLPALVSVVIVQGALLALLAQIIPGFHFSDPVALIPAALVITLAQSVVWPVIYGIAVRFGPWLFPIVSFVLTGAMITFAGWLDDQLGVGGVEVADLWTGVLVAPENRQLVLRRGRRLHRQHG